MPALRIQLNSLTGLRFFAAMAVVLYHLRIYFTPIGESLAIFGYGFTGVSFFFILSGFVLTWSHRAEVHPGRFYWNRVARIWPLHVLTMIVSIWVPAFSPTASPSWTAAPFVLTLTQAWIPASPFLYSFNGVSWSLSCETFFYLLFPLLFRRIASHVRVARIAGIVIAALVIAVIWLSEYSSIPTADYVLGTMPLYRVGEFVLGMCLATAMKRGWRPRFRLPHAVGLTALLTMGLFVSSLILNGMSGPVPVVFANLVMIPGFLALIAASTSRDLSGNRGILVSTSVVRLGQWSFGLYIVHELVIKLAKPFLTDMPPGEAFVVAVLAVVVSITLSGFLHEFIEKPAERWLRSRGGSQKTLPAIIQEVHHPEK